jgi:hypothetical protein
LRGCVPQVPFAGRANAFLSNQTAEFVNSAFYGQRIAHLIPELIAAACADARNILRVADRKRVA